MRTLEHKSAPEPSSGSGALSNLVGALIGELAGEVPDDPKLETVRADLLAASHSYENGKKKDLALRFYLAMRSLLHEYELLHERLRKTEKRIHTLQGGSEIAPLTAGEEEKPEVHTLTATAALPD
jgi:hypothetical protein